MITAIDSSVLMAIDKAEEGWEAWVRLLQNQADLGRLIVCDVVVSEYHALNESKKETFAFFNDLGIEYEPTSPEAALLAGETFALYRKAGGPRNHLIPDFMIGAHALTQADCIAAADRGYLRRYFAKLRVKTP